MEAIENNSVSEFYAFDSIENAQAFVTGYFPAEARTLGGLTSRVCDAEVTKDASVDMSSVYYKGTIKKKHRSA